MRKMARFHAGGMLGLLLTAYDVTAKNGAASSVALAKICGYRVFLK
jgi:hypothetical protein